MKRFRRGWSDFLNLLYQWLATILMWGAIASNFSHIRWYIEEHAIQKDWTAFDLPLSPQPSFFEGRFKRISSRLYTLR